MSARTDGTLVVLGSYIHSKSCFQRYKMPLKSSGRHLVIKKCERTFKYKYKYFFDI